MIILISSVNGPSDLDTAIPIVTFQRILDQEVGDNANFFSPPPNILLPSTGGNDGTVAGNKNAISDNLGNRL